ncbi:MAG: phosphatidylserine/phosphatidylglycerophosphate/cardiolipin synthase family protein [Woeseiaceae bacterium]|nr:phosphatidylserine/phosphatidylglycerophosphate/cardiolipin synthase family protein [Woeseiaceae bacterium]
MRFDRNRRTRQAGWLVLIAVLLVGCGGQPVEHYPTLTGRFAEEANAQPLIAERALLGPSGFELEFRQGDTLYQGGGRLELTPPVDDTVAVETGPLLVPLDYWHEAGEAPPAGDGTPATILGVDDWHVVRNQLFASLIPVGTNEGIVIHFGVDDYFLYFDQNDVFSVSIIDEKPGDYLIAARYSFVELLPLGFDILQAFLEEKGIADSLILINTGDKGAYSLPFVFVDRTIESAAFVRLGSASRDYVGGGSGEAVVATAGHFVTSHTTKMISRPFSSALRLLFMATDTVGETLRIQPTSLADPARIPPLSEGPGMDLDEWERELDDVSDGKRTRGTVRYLIDGEDFFTRFIDEASRAEKSISLRMYIFDNDDYALRIADMLKRRSNEGVDVKILLDGLGTIVSRVEEQESLPEGYLGPASIPAYLESDSEIDVRMAANPWLTGDHVKTLIIDEKLAFTGGMNIAREYRYDWHDMMIELEGPVVNRIQFEFEKAWAHAGIFGDLGYFVRRISPKPRGAGDSGDPMRLLFTRADDPQIFHAQRRAAKRARKYIYVQNAYFTDDAMLYELAQARMRGVDVRVIMPLVTDRGAITKNNALAANALLEHGVRVFIYPGMSHVKAAVFDGWACLGSANLDRWSLKLNKELNIATSEPDAVRRLEQALFDVDFERSVELTEPFPERWSDYLLELVGDYVF